MKRVAHGPNLIQLTWSVAFVPVSCYLVREDDGWTLIDAGVWWSAADILATAEASGAPIRRLAFTHAHVDHVGPLDRLKTELPDAEVLVSAREARILGGDTGRDPGEPGRIYRLPRPRLTRPTGDLSDGLRVASLQVVASPGHSPGHVAFFDLRDGTLIAGDAIHTRGGVAVSGVFRPLYVVSYLVTWHFPAAVASARRLRALNPTRLATGHGPVVEAPLARLDEAIATAERQLARRHGPAAREAPHDDRTGENY